MYFAALEYAAFIIALFVQELPLTIHLSSKHYLCFCCINFLSDRYLSLLTTFQS